MSFWLYSCVRFKKNNGSLGTEFPNSLMFDIVSSNTNNLHNLFPFLSKYLFSSNSVLQIPNPENNININEINNRVSEFGSL